MPNSPRPKGQTPEEAAAAHARAVAAGKANLEYGRAKGLVGFDKMDKEKLREIQSKGGIAAREARARKKTVKEALTWALEMPAYSGNREVNKIKKEFPEMTNLDAMAVAAVHDMLVKPNARTLAVIRDTLGELPVQTVNIQNEEPIKITIETVD